MCGLVSVMAMQNHWHASSTNDGLNEEKHKQQYQQHTNNEHYQYEHQNSESILFGSSINSERSVSAPPDTDRMIEQLGGSGLLLDLGERVVSAGGAVGGSRNGHHAQYNTNTSSSSSNGEFIPSETAWTAGAGHGDERALFGNRHVDRNAGSYYNNGRDTFDSSGGSLTSLQQQHIQHKSGVGVGERQSSYDFGGVGGGNRKADAVNHYDHRATKNQPQSDSRPSSSFTGYESFHGLGLRRPASTGLIGHNKKGDNEQHQLNKSSLAIMESLGLIQSDGLDGGGINSVMDHNSIMDWIEEDFPKNLTLSSKEDGVKEEERYNPHRQSSTLPVVAKKMEENKSTSTTTTVDSLHSKPTLNMNGTTNSFIAARSAHRNTLHQNSSSSANTTIPSHDKNISHSQQQTLVSPFNSQALYNTHNSATTSKRISSSPALLQLQSVSEVSTRQSNENGLSYIHTPLKSEPIMEQTTITNNNLPQQVDVSIPHQSLQQRHHSFQTQSMVRNTQSVQNPPHHDVVLATATHPNYDTQQPQAIYYSGQHNQATANERAMSIPPSLPQVIQTAPPSSTTATVGGGAVYLNPVPSYGGYTMAYYHHAGHPPSPHIQHHHAYNHTTVSNPPPVLHVQAPGLNLSSPAGSSTTSTTRPINSEFISVPIQQHHGHGLSQVATTPAANGAYLYWQQQPTALHPHHTHPHHPTVAVLDSSGRPTAISVSSIPLTGRGGVGLGTTMDCVLDSLSPHNNKSATKQQHHRSRGGEKGGGEYTGKLHGVGGGSRRSSSHRFGKKTAGLDQSKYSGNTLIVGSGGGTNNTSPPSSSVLEEFRLNKTRSWTIHDVSGHIVEFCQDQNGSRFIQQRLEVATTAEKNLVLTEVLPSIRRLRNDVFGNYVVQKLFEHGSAEMKCDLKYTLKGEMLVLSTQMYGCRVVQKALECLDNEDTDCVGGSGECDLLPLLEEFQGHIITCIHDQNGNHVIQKCIEVISNRIRTMLSVKEGRNKFDQKLKQYQNVMKRIVECVLGTTPSLSCHPYGCRVLQRILEHCPENLKIMALDTICESHRDLLDDQYGNYVIQHVLQFGRDEDRVSILGIVVENGLLALSRQKFASNVVEKLLKYGNATIRKGIVREMLKVVDVKGIVNNEEESGNRSSVVLLMVRDAYANYVVQTTLDVIPEGEEKRLLVEELNRNAALLRNYTFAKHIVTKLGGSAEGENT